MTGNSEPPPPRRTQARPAAVRAPRTPRLGRPPQVDREAIVRAAVAVGFGKLGMSTVAQRLGTKHSTLYRYFATRDELVAATVDAVVAETDWPEPSGSWRPDLAAYAWTTYRLLERYPGLAAHIVSLRGTSAAYGRVNERVVTHLVDLGFSAESAILAHDVVHEQVLMFFLAGQGGEGDEGATTPQRAAELRRELLPDALEEVDPRLREALTGIVRGEPGGWFARKLEVLLDGLAGLAPEAA
ncbi:putative TetR family transcriptional regulator [Actinacidiphila reveromycinica]|uniref:Putative TetR family transcriptional regulator n=1 Tax=Actinacidiphila reveromycinica TaxID=659352 RepID=A0A7U3VT29_9ACTN|nr:TetR/AcrR family transcriptional regulator [Streptomyces sp. SN-593]BBB02305.1 putative TetR family transcriptional regulator [Streptomyces sp. SN-593]